MSANLPADTGRKLSSITSSVDDMTAARSISNAAASSERNLMDFVSARVITRDVERLATFWEQVTGLPATRPVPVFAELRTPAGTIAMGAPATIAILGDAAPVPGRNGSVLIELRVDDVDSTWERVKR